MAYYLDLFSPSTFEAFLSSTQDITGFRKKQLIAAKRVKPGDILICYLTKVSRWVAALEVVGNMFEDNTPRFTAIDDPFVVRFKVKPLVVLQTQRGIPIREPIVWDHLSFTKKMKKDGSQWTGPVRSSLKLLDENEGNIC